MSFFEEVECWDSFIKKIKIFRLPDSYKGVGIKYPNEIIKLKAYIYSITSGKNQNDILQKDFNSAVLKFGIDCPFPLIFLTKRLYVLNEKSAKIEEKNNNLEKIKWWMNYWICQKKCKI